MKEGGMDFLCVLSWLLLEKWEHVNLSGLMCTNGIKREMHVWSSYSLSKF